MSKILITNYKIGKEFFLFKGSIFETRETAMKFLSDAGFLLENVSYEEEYMNFEDLWKLKG